MYVKEKWNLKKALAEGKELEPNIMDSIYKNPIIRELPKLAAMYGLYGRFVVSNDCVYFACGVNKDVVHGDFICARDTVIPEYLVKKCGYFLREDVHCGLLNLQCVVISLDDRSSLFHGQVTSMHSAASLLATMETYCHLYKDHGMDIPEFVSSDRHALDELHTCRLALTNQDVLSQSERAAYWKREELLLKDHAIWHWPINKQEDADFSAFSACSRYALNTSSLTKAQRHYKHPEKWEKVFRNKTFDCNFFNETHDDGQMAFLMAGLDSMGIPYRTDIYDEKFLRSCQQEEIALGQALTLKFIQVPMKTIALHRSDVGALALLLTEYLRSQFSEKEHETGKSLYYGSEHTNRTERSAYLFFMDAVFLNDFRPYAAKNQIRWGFPSDIMDGCESDKGCFLVAELDSMTLIRTFLHRKIHRDFSIHAINSSGQPGYEVRTYGPNGISAWVITPGMIKLGEAGHTAVLRDVPWCIPLQELRERGFLVQNE